MDRPDTNAIVQVARKMRALALGIDGTSTEKALLQLAKELERITGTESPEPLVVPQRLYQFSVSRGAFATVNVRAQGYGEALQKAFIEAKTLAASAWMLDDEVEAQEMNSAGDVISPSHHFGESSL